MDENKRILFYLDAHWGEYWPLKDEILSIANSCAKNKCLIIIDDVLVPWRADIPYDEYHGQPLSLEYVIQELRQAIPDLNCDYYIPPVPLIHTRARLLAFPTGWKLG
jgi:hypothetical protein